MKSLPSGIAIISLVLGLAAVTLGAAPTDKAKARGAKVVSKPAGARPVNAKCPVSGEDVDAAITASQDGKLVAFCCNNCKKKFKQDPAKFMKAVMAEQAKAGAKSSEKPAADKKTEKKADAHIVNTICPVSDHDIDPRHTLVQDGKTVGFCSADCAKKFKKDPAAYMKKVALEEEEHAAEEKKTKSDDKPAPVAKAFNKFCPVDKENAVDPTITVEYEGKTVGLCCEDCVKKFDLDPAYYMADVK